jgi:hypothetical protein
MQGSFPTRRGSMPREGLCMASAPDRVGGLRRRVVCQYGRRTNGGSE